MNIRSLYILYISIALFISCSPHGYMTRSGWMFYGDRRERIVRTAKRYIGIKYRNGGTTPFGFDCSGFAMFVYKKNGINIPRGVSAQYRSGRKIGIKTAQPGDLVFFKTSQNKISHVGIYSGDYTFIHAPSTGKRVCSASIWNSYWRKRFICAVTFFDYQKFKNR